MAEPAPTREADVLAKQEVLAAMLRDQNRDGLLVLDPANFSWFTGGATARGLTEPREHPALFVQNAQRWLICSNVDTQRFFDEELDGLGFQLKEWPWQWGRAQLLTDLCLNKRLACDVPFAEFLNVGEQLHSLRRRLSAWERDRLRAAGKAVAHAVEATCRNLERGDSEEEVAGHLCHRLIHHGLEPVSVEVSADGRLRRYRRGGPTSAQVQQTCVVQATARRHGLHLTASRAVSFGPPDDQFHREIETACRWSAALIAGCIAAARLEGILHYGGRVLQAGGFEHEWRLASIGWVTGHAAQELPLLPGETARVLEAGWAVVWQASVGAVTNADTILVSDGDPEIVTPAELWPLKRAHVGGKTIDRPDLLVRNEK